MCDNNLQYNYHSRLCVCVGRACSYAEAGGGGIGLWSRRTQIYVRVRDVHNTEPLQKARHTYLGFRHPAQRACSLSVMLMRRHDITR